MLIDKIKCYTKQLLEQQNTFSETGVVIEVRPKRIAIVSCSGGSSCSGCSAAGGCCSGDGAGKKRIYADNIPHARSGDTVRVEIETTAGIADSQSFLYIIAFIMLAFGLAVGYFIATLLPVGISAALLSLLIGCAFMVGTMAVLRFSRPAVVQTSLAKIVEIISAADDGEVTS
jgi:positive regulator of sigma E activity